MLSRQCEAIRNGAESLFLKEYLLKPKALNFGGTVLNRASAACLSCGAVYEGDLVWTRSGTSVVVGTVLGFWQPLGSPHISVQVRGYQRIDGTFRFDTSVHTIGFFSTATVVDTMAYAKLDGGLLLVIPPASEL